MNAAPVQHILKDEVIRFSAASGSDLSIYHGYPTPENDAAWKDLYRREYHVVLSWSIDYNTGQLDGAQKIPKSQASHLPNETIDWPEDEENSMILLDVFHQLHCLVKRHGHVGPLLLLS